MVTENHTALISTGLLAEHLMDPNYRIFDCRFRLSDPHAGRNAYHQGHIPGAVYVDLERDLSGPVTANTGRHPLPEADVWRATVQQLGIEPGNQVVVYDDSFGSIAARMWWALRWLGHVSVAVMDGGWSAWVREKRLVNTATPHVRPATKPHKYAPQRGMWVSSEEVEQGLETPAKVLIDARSERRFLALEEPFDRVAGHIPGAINIPFEDNLDLDGTFLSAESVRAVYADALTGHHSTDIILMCGSGVTACHSIVALENAGIQGVKLYAGSWSEWIVNDKRPMVKN